MASTEMPGTSMTSTPASKKQNHLAAGRRKLDAYRKKKAEEKKVGDKNILVQKPIGNDIYEEGILSNGTGSGHSVEGNGKETHKVLQSNVGVKGGVVQSAGDESISNGSPEGKWLKRATGNEPHNISSSAIGSVQGLSPFWEKFPAPTITAATLHEGDLPVRTSEYSDNNPSSRKTAFQNFADLAGSVHERIQGTQEGERSSSSNASESDITSGALANNGFIPLKHEEPPRVIADVSLPSRIGDRSLQKPSGSLFGTRKGFLQDVSSGYSVSKQQADTTALNLASFIKDDRVGSGQEDFRSAVTSNGMKPKDSKEPQFLFAQMKKSPFSDLGERDSFSSLRLPDKTLPQPSSELVSTLASGPSILDHKGDLSLSVSAFARADASPEQEEPINQNEGRPERVNNDDFIALEQHIDELTQEKFALQRALDAARSLAESLLQQNSVLTEDFNSQGAIISQLQADLEKKNEEVSTQSLVLKNLMMERERAQQENNSAVERLQILAGEVIGLEEKVLKLRSSELKLQRELETLTSDHELFRAHSNTVEMDRQNMRAMLESLQEDKKLLQTQLLKSVVNNDGMRTPNLKEVAQGDFKDASTSTDDLGVEALNTQNGGSVVQRHLGNPQLNRSSDITGDASSSVIASSPYWTGIDVPSVFASLSADDFRAINNIDGLITEVLLKKSELLVSLERESEKNSELQALNFELTRKLETQTQRLELAVAQNMAHGATAVAADSIEIEPEYNNYVDEGDEVVERVLGWIMRIFPGGSSRRQSSKLL